MKKETTRKQCHVLAVIWTLAAAAVGVAFVRRLPQVHLLLLALLALSLVSAVSWWRAYKMTPERSEFDEETDPNNNLEEIDDE